MVMKKNKPDNKVMFINAENEFVKETNQSRLSEGSLAQIMKWYEDREDVEYRVKIAPYDDIVKAKYNLSVSTYVGKEDTREVIDIDNLNKRLDEVVAKENQLRSDIAEIVKEIG